MGYLRARRSIRLGPGVKLNLNKRSLGVTVGGRGTHYSVNTHGQRTTSVGLPGTGLSYVDRSSTRRSPRPRAPVAATTAPAAATAAKRPGLFARHYERAFFDAIQKLAAGDPEAALTAFVLADEHDDKHRVISPAMFAGLLTAQLGDPAAAIPYLERVAASEVHLPDALMNKYAGTLESSLRVDGQISIPMEIGSAAASFVLAQCYRDTGRLDEAIGVMQQLYEHAQSPEMLMALCNMYLRAEAWDEIVHVTAGTSNEDDVTLIVRLQQAEAMERQGFPDAALEAYRDALRSKRRSPELLKQARYGRAKLYLSTGKRGMAKRDLGRLYGEDPDYKDVSVLLRDLA